MSITPLKATHRVLSRQLTKVTNQLIAARQAKDEALVHELNQLSKTVAAKFNVVHANAQASEYFGHPA